MSFTNICKQAAVCFSVIIISELIYTGWGRWRYKGSALSPVGRRRSIHEAIMFRPHDVEYRGVKSNYSRCIISPQLDRLLFHLASARHSLDCAVYVLTNNDIANVIASLIRHGVTVRCIADADMSYATNSQVRRLGSLGAHIRSKKSVNLMHHKFCIIDANAEGPNVTPRVMTGSLNWTSQALSGNWENVLVTSNEELVARYKIEFETLWTDFKMEL